MKKLLLLSAGFAATAAALSSSIASAQVVGKVISSTPITSQVTEPRSVCTATAAGKQTCRMENGTETRTVAYKVIYEYGGRQHEVELTQQPGATIELELSHSVPTSAQATGAAPGQPAAVAQSQAYAPAQASATPQPTYSAPPAAAARQPAYESAAPAHQYMPPAYEAAQTVYVERVVREPVYVHEPVYVREPVYAAPRYYPAPAYYPELYNPVYPLIGAALAYTNYYPRGHYSNYRPVYSHGYRGHGHGNHGHGGHGHSRRH